MSKKYVLIMPRYGAAKFKQFETNAEQDSEEFEGILEELDESYFPSVLLTSKEFEKALFEMRNARCEVVV